MGQRIYAEHCPVGRLTQGDILDKYKLVETLKGHQQYFSDKLYFRRFVVMSQTCDLVPDRPAGFVFLSVVRHLEDALEHRDLHTSGAKNRTEQIVKDLINYNYNKRGYFFLPARNDSGIERDSVIDMRVMFTLRIKHYSELLAARVGSLSELFSAKLGSMAGEMFARVAVDSWDDGGYTISSKEKIAAIMSGCESREDLQLHALWAKHGKNCVHCEKVGKEELAVTYRRSVHGPTFQDVFFVFCKPCAERFDDCLNSQPPNRFATKRAER